MSVKPIIIQWDWSYTLSWMIKLLLKYVFTVNTELKKNSFWATEREFLFLRTRSNWWYILNLSPISTWLLLFRQKKVWHFSFVHLCVIICYKYLLFILVLQQFFFNWSAIHTIMRLSVVFELLLIFLIIAFAAYGRVGKSWILSTNFSCIMTIFLFFSPRK